MANGAQTLSEHLDEDRDVLVELELPHVACERGVALEDARGYGREHQDELLYLPVLLHLSLERVGGRGAIERGKSSPNELVRIPVRA